MRTPRKLRRDLQSGALRRIHQQAGWTTAEYILGLIVLAGVVSAVVAALGGKLQGLIGQLPF